MIRIESVTVKADRLIAVVRVEKGTPFFVSHAMMLRVLERYPDLPSHPCVNANGPRFSDVMEQTSVPHLLEHIVIDLQAEAYTQLHAEQTAYRHEQAPLLMGVTKWIARDEGLAQIQVNYFDDVIALRALRDAVAFLNELN